MASTSSTSPSTPLELLKELLRFKSITPSDDGALNFIALALPGFEAHFIEEGGVRNLLLTKQFSQQGDHLAFSGHIDVVSPGPGWASDPFEPVESEGYIYARGAQDMKAGVAAFLAVARRVVAAREGAGEGTGEGAGERAGVGRAGSGESGEASIPFSGGRLSLLITSDEEGEAKFGTAGILRWMRDKNLLPDYALVAEPSCSRKMGDAIKIGRRGSLSGRLLIRGRQAHVAYPELAINPIHDFAPVLKLLAGFDLDPGSAAFAPSKIIITEIHAGLGVGNVSPGELVLHFNVRNSPDTGPEDVRAYVERVCHGLNFELDLTQHCQPFLTAADNKLIARLNESVQKITGLLPELNTKGGTSDARFFAELGICVAEFGTRNDRMHAVDERVSVEDFEALMRVFADVVENF